LLVLLRRTDGARGNAPRGEGRIGCATVLSLSADALGRWRVEFYSQARAWDDRVG
jgi:hypothetical protein